MSIPKPKMLKRKERQEGRKEKIDSTETFVSALG